MIDASSGARKGWRRPGSSGAERRCDPPAPPPKMTFVPEVGPPQGQMALGGRGAPLSTPRSPLRGLGPFCW